MNPVITYYIVTFIAIVLMGSLVSRIYYYKGLRDAYDDVDEELIKLIDKYEKEKES